MLVAAVVALLLAAASADAAAGAAHATVTGCKGDQMTVVGAVKLSGRQARAARGAVLQLRFSAMALFGFPHTGIWHTIGKKTKGSSQETFSGLPADHWDGVMSWRFKKGRKTVLSGDERSQPGRVGGVRGAASCTLAEGLKPADTTPPIVYLLPVDNVWHHTPAQVYAFAQDDFSGVRTVTYSIDGGPAVQMRNGSTFDIVPEGAHNVHIEATDVAGNTGTKDAVVRVDAAPPSKPVLSRPFSVTASTTPTFTWSPSTDTGSGVKGYFLSIKRVSDGSQVAFQPYDANTTSVTSPVTLTDGQSYTATVVAIDNTDTPFSSESDPLTFKVDTSPGIASSNPSNGAIVTSSLTTMTVKLDRPAQKPVNATLAQVDGTGGDPTVDSVTCDSSCTTITVTAHNALQEGRYALTLNGVKSQEGVAIPGTVKFAVPFDQNDDSVPATPGLCVDPSTTSKSFSFSTNDNNEGGRFTFHWAINAASSWTARVFNGATTGGTPLGPQISGSGTSGDATIDFNLGSKTGSPFTIGFTVTCASSSTQLTISNLLGTRLP